MKRWLWVWALAAYAQVVGPPPRQPVDIARPDAQPRDTGQPRTRIGTGTADAPSEVQVVVRLAQSGLSISEMACEIHQFSHDTRAVTCGLTGNQPSYSGVLVVSFADGTFWSRTVFVEQPIYNGKMAAWGIAVIPAYGSVAITQVTFSNGQPLAVWDQTQAARGTLQGTYAYPKADTYPPAVVINDMTCHTSEFLIGKSQAAITPTYVVTCATAGDRQYYGGTVAIWWHQFESRIAEKGTPPPVPLANSTWDTAQHSRYVRVQHDLFGSEMSYWGLSAFALESSTRIAWDRMNFYPEREEATFASADEVPQEPYKASSFCRTLPLLCRHKKKPYLR